MRSTWTAAQMTSWLAAAVYLASMALPAFRGDDMVGGGAFVLGGIGVAFVFEGDAPGIGFCCLFGSLANLGFIVGWLLFVLRAVTPLRRPRFGTIAFVTIAACVCGIASAAGLIALSFEFTAGVGCLAWLAAQAMLAAGTLMLARRDARRRTAPGGFPVVLRAELT